jgi:hypothetical protein
MCLWVMQPKLKNLAALSSIVPDLSSKVNVFVIW